MNSKIYLLSVLVIICISNSIGQYYTSGDLTQIINSKNGNEGDFYIDTLNNNYYIGTTNGELIQFNSDSVHLKKFISKFILDEKDLNSNDNNKIASQQSIKFYIDSLNTQTNQNLNTKVEIDNELFFDGKDHSTSNYTDYYYISMVVDSGYCVVRYNKTDINDEAKSESNNAPQPSLLNDIVNLIFN